MRELLDTWKWQSWQTSSNTHEIALISILRTSVMILTRMRSRNHHHAHPLKVTKIDWLALDTQKDVIRAKLISWKHIKGESRPKRSWNICWGYCKDISTRKGRTERNISLRGSRFGGTSTTTMVNSQVFWWLETVHNRLLYLQEAI